MGRPRAMARRGRRARSREGRRRISSRGAPEAAPCRGDVVRREAVTFTSGGVEDCRLVKVGQRWREGDRKWDPAAPKPVHQNLKHALYEARTKRR